MPTKRELAKMVESIPDVEMLTERITDLELALEDIGFTQLAITSEMEFSRAGLRKIAALARIMYLKNPLIQRGVNVQSHYVFGQGVGIRAKAGPVNDILQVFLDDEKNKAELTSHQARTGKEVELQIEANLFFVLFTDKSTGRVRIRTIPCSEVEDIICNPEDRKDPWYYKRTWTQAGFNPATGLNEFKTKTVYYPDWRYSPRSKPQTIGWDEVAWDCPVYHVKVGGLPDMKFGVSEVYAAIDWARAYKEFLENWSTLMAAYARLAWKMTHAGGAAGVAAAKAKLGTTAGNFSGETNPPPLVGSTFISTSGVDMQPIRTAGATTSAEDGRRLLLMVCAAMGLPESFFGDVTGTYATAKSLDRPTELQMVSRQMLWADVFQNICNYVLWQAVEAGVLDGTLTMEDDGTPCLELGIDPETGEPMDPTIDVSFSPVLEHDVQASVAAITMAATLDGHAPAGTIDPETVSQLLLSALGVKDMNAVLDKLFPEDLAQAESAIAKAAMELREALREFTTA